MGDQYPESSAEQFYSDELYVPELGKLQEYGDSYEQVGYSFLSSDGQRRFRARLDGFDYSISEPYDRWEPFRDEAHRLWGIYKSVTGAVQAVRVAVRYVNRLDIPSRQNEYGENVARLEHYLRISPEVPDDWPNGDLLRNFFMQLQMWQRDLECMLIVNEAPDIPPQPGIVSIRLDFDLFKERYEEPRDVHDDSKIWEFLEKLHERKNEVFEASITDETRELIS